MDDRKSLRVGYLRTLAWLLGITQAGAIGIEAQKLAQREGGAWDPVAIAMILLIIYFYVFRMGGAGIRVEPDRIVVLNLFRRIKIDQPESPRHQG